MRVTTERLENCQVNVIIELDAAEAEEKIRETARQISRKFNVPGYRRGKAPVQAVLRAFGREAIQQQAIDDFGQELYEKGLAEIEYKPYQMGELQEVTWDPFQMRVLLPIQPEVDLGDYRSLRLAYEVQPVTEEQIATYLAELQQQNAQWIPVERPAAFSDQVTIDMEAHVGDQRLLNQENHETILKAEARTPLPGFSEEIVGMSAGQEKTFVLKVPENYPAAEVAGQDATVVVRLQVVKEQELPPLDDELAMMVGDYETLEALKAGVREGLEKEAQQRAASEYLEKALEAYIAGCAKLEYPPQAIDREAEVALDRMESNLAASGLQLDAYLRMIGKTREGYKQDLRPAAEQRLKKRIVLSQLAKIERLEVQPEEIDAEIDRMRDLMGPQGEETLKTLSSPAGRLLVADDLITAKAEERAVQIAKGEAPPLSAEAEAGAEGDALAEGNTRVDAEPVAGADADAGEPLAEVPPHEQPDQIEPNEAADDPAL